MNFQLTSKELKSQNLTISVELGIYTKEGSVHPYPTELLYQLCTSSACDKTLSSPIFQNSTLKPIFGREGPIPNVSNNLFVFEHEASLCADYSTCYYVFQVYNPAGNTDPV